MEMRTAKLKKDIAIWATVITGLLHAVTYGLKTDECQYCHNYVDSWVVVAFHITNYLFWYFLAACVLLNKTIAPLRLLFYGIQSIAMFLVSIEIAGHPKGWTAFEGLFFIIAVLHPVTIYIHEVLLNKDWYLKIVTTIQNAIFNK